MRLMRAEALGVVGLIVAVIMQYYALSGGASRVVAQDGESCEQLATQAISSARASCADVARGILCSGHSHVTIIKREDAELALEQGETVLISEMVMATTGAIQPDTQSWGIAVFDLPVTTEGVEGVLFGDAQIGRPQQVRAERPTLEVYNRGSVEINIRNGAGITYDVVGQLAAEETALADGRNQQGDWVRIRFTDGVAWVFTPLIGWEGEQAAINTLEVLLPNDVTPVFETEEPFQSFTLVTGASECGAAPSGLLLQATGQESASILINQARLEFSEASLVVTAALGDALNVRVLTGSVAITARGLAQDIAAGSGARVALGGDDGLTPVSTPERLRTYAFQDVAYAPLDLLSQQVACMVGASTQRTDVGLRVGPGTNRGEIGTLSSTASYAVLGWANDSDGRPWWKLDTGEQASWVAKADVGTLGACSEIAQVEPPPLVFAPAAPVEPGDAAMSTVDLAPAANSVWQMVPGSDNMVGECSGAPAINFCDHLAAIAPAGGGISWRGMEPSPYYLAQVQPNIYAYSGPNVAGTGTVSMTLRFTSETSLSMTMSLVLSSEPNCQHVYYYSGTRNW